MGMPDNVKGEESPLLVKVFQWVGIYDAFSHFRPYKTARPIEKIIGLYEEEIRVEWRDPYLGQAFVNILKMSPELLAYPYFRRPLDPIHKLRVYITRMVPIYVLC